LENFTIYPKEGKEFTLRCERFEVVENSFIFHHSGDQPSDEVFVSFHDVAAIVPERQPFANIEDLKPFEMYLRNRDAPILVYANAFDMKGTPTVKFFYRDFSNDPLVEIKGIYYVASSEVVAIFPSEGLERVRKRSTRGFPS